MKELMENTNHKKLDFHFTDIWSNFSFSRISISKLIFKFQIGTRYSGKLASFHFLIVIRIFIYKIFFPSSFLQLLSKANFYSYSDYIEISSAISYFHLNSYIYRVLLVRIKYLLCDIMYIAKNMEYISTVVCNCLSIRISFRFSPVLVTCYYLFSFFFFSFTFTPISNNPWILVVL